MRRRGINHSRVQHVARRVDYRDFAARSVCGVYRKYGLAFERRLHEQRTQIHLEHFDCLFVSHVGQLVSDLAFYGGENQPVVGVLRRSLQNSSENAVALYVGGLHLCKRGFPVLHYTDLQALLFFAAIYRKHPVRGNFGDFLAVVGVHFVYASLFLFGVDLLGGYIRLVFEKLSERLSQLGVVGNHFRYYVRSAFESLFGVFHSLFGVYERSGQLRYIPFRRLLRVYKVGKRLKPLFYRDGRARLFLLLEGTVHVLHFGKRLRAFQSRRHLVGHFSLLGDGVENLLLALGKIAQISKPVRELSQHLVVAGVVHFLPVTRYKGNCVSLVNQRYYIFAVNFLQIKFGCQLFC